MNLVSQVEIDLTEYINPNEIGIVSDVSKLRAFIDYVKEHSPEIAAYAKEHFQFTIAKIQLETEGDDDIIGKEFQAATVEVVVADVAAKLNVTLLEACTRMQATAARQKNEALLDALCAYKWKLIEQAGIV